MATTLISLSSAVVRNSWQFVDACSIWKVSSVGWNGFRPCLSPNWEALSSSSAGTRSLEIPDPLPGTQTNGVCAGEKQIAEKDIYNVLYYTYIMRSILLYYTFLDSPTS